MRKTLIAILMALALVVIPAGSALAVDPTVTVTATPSFLGIENSPSTWLAGTVTAAVNKLSGEANFTITNVGNVAVNTTIGCNGWSGTRFWTYGPAGADTGRLQASIGAGYIIQVPSGSTIALKDNILAGGTQTWGLQLEAPSSFTHGYLQTTTVTITAASL